MLVNAIIASEVHSQYLFIFMFIFIYLYLYIYLFIYLFVNYVTKLYHLNLQNAEALV